MSGTIYGQSWLLTKHSCYTIKFTEIMDGDVCIGIRVETLGSNETKDLGKGHARLEWRRLVCDEGCVVMTARPYDMDKIFGSMSKMTKIHEKIKEHTWEEYAKYESKLDRRDNYALEA